jgi:hypothetical protein
VSLSSLTAAMEAGQRAGDRRRLWGGCCEVAVLASWQRQAVRARSGSLIWILRAAAEASSSRGVVPAGWRRPSGGLRHWPRMVPCRQRGPDVGPSGPDLSLGCDRGDLAPPGAVQRHPAGRWRPSARAWRGCSLLHLPRV